ncbi:MAG: hypothetical protein QM619_09705 [Micropruina sp.]|uniref:hypothetical protein n=1 Tax=Micropruina sp. TaxID=2737536 RepID=UPI0039E701F3
MSATTTHEDDPQVVSVRRLPSAQGTPSTRPKWEVSYGSETQGWTVIGWIEEELLGRGRTRFYFAVGIHPETGKHYRLEGHPNFDNRVNTVADFHIDPMTSSQHLGASNPYP